MSIYCTTSFGCGSEKLGKQENEKIVQIIKIVKNREFFLEGENPFERTEQLCRIAYSYGSSGLRSGDEHPPLHYVGTSVVFTICVARPLHLQLDIIRAVMIVWRIRGKLSELFCAVLCTHIRAVLKDECWFRFSFCAFV